jgi:DNA-binding MarR family transcriptional regulator
MLPTLVYLVGRVDHGVRRELQRRLAPHELSVPELTALSVLQRQPGLSIAQIARRSLVSPQAMGYVILALEQGGLVQRHADPLHGRMLRARLTPAGLGKLRHVNPKRTNRRRCGIRRNRGTMPFAGFLPVGGTGLEPVTSCL